MKLPGIYFCATLFCIVLPTWDLAAAEGEGNQADQNKDGAKSTPAPEPPRKKKKQREPDPYEEDHYGVIEIDDSFPDKKGDKPWLVMFYAPWCGHCRKLEPVYHQVWMELHESNEGIHVAKVDATKYSSLAAQYDVHGFPTIKFIEGDKVFTHRGDRSRDAIITFSRRAAGPPVRNVTNTGKFNDIRSDLSEEVFYTYIGSLDNDNDLLKKYHTVADKYEVHSFFYAGDNKILPAHIKPKHEPTLLVFKDDSHYEYDPIEGGWSQESVESFVNGERFLAYPKVKGAALNDFVDLNKRIVAIILDEKLTSAKNDRFKELGSIIATQHRDKFHKHYQFIWMGDPETANSITMSRPIPPYIFIMEPDTQVYYLPQGGFDVHDMTLDEVVAFLEEVKEGKTIGFGGTGFVQRFKRFFYDIWTTVYGIYHESPWLALLVFGVPTIVISIVCYALCYMEPFDEEAFYEELAEEARQVQLMEEEKKKKALQEGEGEGDGAQEVAATTTTAEDDGHIKKE